MPGDLSPQFASPNAGAGFVTTTSDDPFIRKCGYYSYKKLHEIQLNHFFRDSLVLTNIEETWDEVPDPQSIADFSTYVKDFRLMTEDELPLSAKFGIKFTSWVINAPLFMERFNFFLSSKGVTIVKKHINHIDEAFLDHTSVVFNCTGLGSLTLGGVEDKDVFPTRAQVVVAKAPHIEKTQFHWGKDATYIIKRPNSKDELILGGFYQPHNWHRDILGHETKDILDRTTKLCPEILQNNALGKHIGDLEIKRVVAALRPSRKGGPLIRRDDLKDGKMIIHNYGAEGSGYMLGPGFSNHAVSLLDILKPSL